MEIDFLGAAPTTADGDTSELVSNVVEATLAYARDARRRMILHHTKWIAVTVPFDEAKRPLFEAAEAILLNFAVRFDWSRFTSWTVDKASAGDLGNLDDHLAMTEQGWQVRTHANTPCVFALDPARARAEAARLLACADAADERNTLMPVSAAGEEPPAPTDGAVAS